MTTEAPAPLITSLRITGFQSLHDISLTLEPFTVIVGPSSSGKSALVRAIKTLTNNARGTAYITHGFTKTSIEATLAHGDIVTLTRGTGTKAEHNAYTHQTPEPYAATATFTKLAGEVPDEIAKALTLPGDPTLTFAGQFDKPYLLDASPAEVARTLASLTNVHTIFNAAREANRTRLAHSATLRTRTTDLEAIRLRTQEFRSLATRRAHQAAAEAAIERAQQIATSIERLSALLTFHESATRGIDTFKPLANIMIPDMTALDFQVMTVERLRTTLTAAHDAAYTLMHNRTAALSPLPTIEPAANAYIALRAYRDALVALRTANAEARAHTLALVEAGDEHTSAQDAYINALTEAGTCPTCGQDTGHYADIHLEKIHA